MLPGNDSEENELKSDTEAPLCDDHTGINLDKYEGWTLRARNTYLDRNPYVRKLLARYGRAWARNMTPNIDEAEPLVSASALLLGTPEITSERHIRACHLLTDDNVSDADESETELLLLSTARETALTLLCKRYES